MNITAVCLCTAAILAVVVIVLAKFFRNSTGSSFPIKQVDELSFKDILAFFKQETVINQLRNNPDLVAVALKSREKDGFRVILCSFSKTDNKIIEPFQA